MESKDKLITTLSRMAESTKDSYTKKHLILLIEGLKSDSQQSQQGGWVSVDDKMPEKNKEVLVSVKYQNEPILVYLDNNGKWIGSRETRDWMVDGFCLDSELVKSIEITHWQSLPLPPNQKK